MNALIYPWHEAIWTQLHATKGRRSHAMLLKGKQGTGKYDFARIWAKSLLCESPDLKGFACGSCLSCGWFEQNNHPDFRLLTPEQDMETGEEGTSVPKSTGKKSQISVAQVRELSGFLELSSHRGEGIRIALIHPAETLNLSSANALLKMLEEPPPGVLFLLVSNQPQRLLPTIMSRCLKVDMPLPDTQSALAWLTAQQVRDAERYLEYAGGSPLIALQDSLESNTKLADIWKMLGRGAKSDAFSLAPALVSLGMETAITVLQKWIYDLVAISLRSHVRYHAHMADSFQSLTKSVDLGMLLDFQKKLDEARKSANHPLNNELQLESILLQYSQLFSRG